MTFYLLIRKVWIGQARFFTAALLHDHLRGPEIKQRCIHNGWLVDSSHMSYNWYWPRLSISGMKLRCGGMQRHWKKKNKEEPFPYHIYDRYKRKGGTGEWVLTSLHCMNFSLGYDYLFNFPSYIFLLHAIILYLTCYCGIGHSYVDAESQGVGAMYSSGFTWQN